MKDFLFMALLWGGSYVGGEGGGKTQIAANYSTCQPFPDDAENDACSALYGSTLSTYSREMFRPVLLLLHFLL